MTLMKFIFEELVIIRKSAMQRKRCHVVRYCSRRRLDEMCGVKIFAAMWIEVYMCRWKKGFEGILNWLVVWNMVNFSIQLGISSSQLTKSYVSEG